MDHQVMAELVIMSTYINIVLEVQIAVVHLVEPIKVQEDLDVVDLQWVVDV